MKSTKTNFKKKIITKILKHKKNKESITLWITIVIHSAMCVGEQWFPHTL
jgi:hypothetical protein